MLVIENHVDVMKNADWILDLGPGAGDEGGWLVTTGTPESVSREPQSLTGRYLKPVLERHRPDAVAV